MDKQEIKLLADTLDEVCNHVPNGLWPLKDSLKFAIMELRMYYQFGKQGSTFLKALNFAKSVPTFENYDSEECFQWMMNDEEHLIYMP